MTNVLAEKAVLASLSISRWGARKFDQKVTNEVAARHGAASEVGRYTKKLVAKEAMADIGSIAHEARAFHYERTQPWLDDGARILPSALFLEYSDKMREFRQRFDAATAKFIDGYPDVVQEAKKRLNGLFDERDYPRPSQIHRHFGFDVAILPCPDAKDFRLTIPEGLRADVQADAERRLEQALRNTVTDSAQRITDTIGHMAERLAAYVPTPKKKGEKAEGVFRDSLVENVRELAAVLPAFNMTADPKLDAVIARIERSLCKHDAGDLRDNDRLRAQVAKEAAAIVKSVSDFI